MTAKLHFPHRVPASTSVATAPAKVQAGARLLYIDNIRIVLTMMVVSLHLAITYGAEGSWFYRERPVDLISAVALTMLAVWSQGFFMGLFFLISGYFTPGSLDRKGTWGFLKDRLIRLGIPLVIYMLLFSPYVEAVKGTQEGWLEGPLGSAVAQQYRNLAFTPGPMWFVEALLVFSAVYALGRAAIARLWPERASRKPAEIKLTHAIVLAGALLIAAATFVARLAYPMGAEWQHLQLGAFPQYVILFAAGILAKRHGWLPEIAPSIRKVWTAVAVLGLIALPVIMVAGGAVEDIEPFLGGPTWQSLLYSSWEAFYCVGMCVLFLGLFYQRFNHQGNLARAMAGDAYTVYFIHAPIIVTLGILLSGIALFPLLKWAVVMPIGVALCFLIAHLVRRIPGATRIL